MAGKAIGKVMHALFITLGLYVVMQVDQTSTPVARRLMDTPAYSTIGQVTQSLQTSTLAANFDETVLRITN